MPPRLEVGEEEKKEQGEKEEKVTTAMTMLERWWRITIVITIVIGGRSRGIGMSGGEERWPMLLLQREHSREMVRKSTTKSRS